MKKSHSNSGLIPMREITIVGTKREKRWWLSAAWPHEHSSFFLIVSPTPPSLTKLSRKPVLFKSRFSGAIEFHIWVSGFYRDIQTTETVLRIGIHKTHKPHTFIHHPVYCACCLPFPVVPAVIYDTLQKETHTSLMVEFYPNSQCPKHKSLLHSP